jgi:phosphotransferase system HPr (HPr) family protein
VIETPIEIVNRLGLHARAAAKLVHLASGFESEIHLVSSDGEEIDAKSILGILLLAAGQGTRVVLRCAGADERRATDEIVALFADRFGEGE